MKKTILLASLLACALPAAAQQPSNNQQATMPKLVENIDVRVINVDVVVTDKKGKPVTGLTKDDFVLFENGNPKPISNFYEVNGAEPEPKPEATKPNEPPHPLRAEDIPDTQKRRIIFFIDNLSLNPFNRNRVFKQMKDFISQVMRPGDEAMIATFNRSMKVRVPFTRDPVQLQQTLDVIAGESALGVNNKSDLESTESQIRDAQSYDDALSAARSYAQSSQHDLRQAVDSLDALMSTLAGVDGKKVLVLTSEGFPMQPGREAFAYLEDQGHEKGWPTSSMLEGMSFDSHELIREVGKTANANGITMYTIHAAGLAVSSDVSAENARATSFSVTQALVSNTTDSMAMMAEMTGGLASLQTNNYAAAFAHIKRDLDSYYSLGYRAGTERVDRQRSLEVRVKNRNYTVRSRQSFVEKSTYAEMSDRVIANLLYTSKQNDLHIVVKSDRPRVTDDSGLFEVPVEVQIPMDMLTFIPQGETQFAGGFDVYFVLANKNNDLSDVSRQSHQIIVPAADMAKSKGKYYTYSVEMLMERGVNRISVGVVDSVSNVTGFARDQIIAQDLR